MSDQQNQWSNDYQELVQRNVGFITAEQQEKLRSTKVAVFGVGGIGGTAFEVLVRTGIGKFSIADRDRYDATNMNRQVFAYRHTIGELKIDVAADWAKQINTDVEIDKFDHVDEDNIAEILEGADVAVFGIDSLGPCIIASRKAREMGIPIVEGWAIPYGNVRVFTNETPSLEEAYGLPTAGRKVADISEDELKKLNVDLLLGLGRIEGIPGFYTAETVEKIRSGFIVSFAPTVWLTAVMIALETVKVILDWGRIALADPEFTLYDPFKHRIPTVT